jgi:hypothetical protein
MHDKFRNAAKDTLLFGVCIIVLVVISYESFLLKRRNR